MTRLRGTRAALALAATSALLLTGTTFTAVTASAAAVATPVITPAQALKTLAAYFPANNKANAKHSTAIINTIETGAPAFEDESFNDIAHTLHLPPGSPFTGAAPKVFVPYQTSYPAVFVAQFRYKNPGQPADKKSVVYFLFGKAKATDTWRLSASSVVGTGSPLPVFTLDSSGYLPPLPTLSVGRAQLETLWVKALRTSSITGKVPGKPWKSNSLLASFAKYETNSTTPYRHLTYTSTPWAPVCVAASGGGLCFASVGFSDAIKVAAADAAQGMHFTVSTVAEQIATGGLPQGAYLALTTYRVRDSLLLVAKKGATGVRLVGSDTNVVGGTGVPATAQ
ncbi:hypothetical protein acdb102_13720 [Acidothermaceae bacterium B102]|nr:hypothetical protein acdb102_13720 [Acidothermaceae bacterium B102]